MLTKEDFIKQYENYSDNELYHLLKNKDQYSEEGQIAIDEVVKNKGGIERLELIIQQNFEIDKEKKRIYSEAKKLAASPDVNEEFLQKIITSEKLPRNEINQIINTAYLDVTSHRKDTKITPRTIYGSLAGSAIATIAGGILWGLQLIQMHRMFAILAIGLFIISYGIIRLFTKQSRNNIVVLIASCVATGLAIGLGFIIYDMFG